jgi:hypothetical protein
MHEYSRPGFPGCVGLLVCTHIITDCCQYNLKNNHLGAKSSLTMRTFNLTCNCHCRISDSTHGGPDRWNNQTMVRLDLFVSGIHDGSILDNVSFELLAHDKIGSLKTLIFTRVYVIVIKGILTGCARCHHLELPTTLKRFVSLSGLNPCGRMWSVHWAY